MSDFSYLSEPAEANLRAAFCGERYVPHGTLLDRMQERFGYRNRNYVSNIIADAWTHGMVSRTRTGANGVFLYSLVPGWERPAMQKRQRTGSAHNASHRRGMQERHDLAPAVPYEGPAFGAGAPVPSVGVVCGETQEEREGELPPWLGGRIVDSLHRGFDEILGGVE